MHTRASNSELVEPLPEPKRTLNRRLRRRNRRVPYDQRNNPPQHPRIVYPLILDINHFRHFLDILRNYDPIDDEPMWAADYVVASIPGSKITIPETANEFAIKGNHLTLVKRNQFDGRTKTDPHKHIHEFLRICDMFKYKDTENEVVRLMMFPLSLTGEAKTWLDELNEGTIETWDELRTAFISRFFPPALFDRLLKEIRAFSQHENESLTDAWLRMKEMLQNCHGHNPSKGNIIKIFYHGLSEITQEVLNAATGGIFLYKTPNQAYQLLKKKVLLKLDWAKNQKTKSSLKKIVAFAIEGNTNTDTDKIMARMDAMTIKMDAQLADKQFGRPSGSLPSNTQPNPRGSNFKAYQPPQARNEHVNVVFTRSGKFYDPLDNSNDQHNNFGNPINFDSDDEDDEPTPQPKTQPTIPVKETPLPKPYKPKIPFSCNALADLELKPLPNNLEYVFLDEPSFLPMIISSKLSTENKSKLVSILKKIRKPLLGKRQTFLCVPKKGGITVVTNKNEELVPTRTVTGWRNPLKYSWMISLSLETLSTNVNKLNKMLQRCKDVHLVLNWKKCHFMVKEGIMLRHKVSSAGLEVDKVKINVISKLPPPTNIKGVESFLGHADFYRRFIKDFLKIARPLTKLLEKDTPFEFNDECQKEFELLKEKLTCTPVIVSPNWNLPFELMCDISDFTVGAVLDFANYLVADIIPKGMTYQQKNKFFSDIKHYFWEEPYLFKVCSDGMIRRCVSGLETRTILDQCHHGSTDGHYRPNVTTKKVLDSGFYWPTIIKEAHTVVCLCEACQKTGNISKRDEMSLTNIQALPTNGARVVITFLKKLFCHFRMPKALISDRGTHFCNKIIERTMKRYGVNHCFSTSYQPQTSGQVENTNRALKRILEKTVKDNPAIWSRKLDDAPWAFHTAYKTPTGTTPYKLIYGKNYHIPFEIEHRAYSALKNCNPDLIAAGEK
ncbi:reverse transcriptase domain-containing protein [Tanacetum coccineum]